MLTTGASCGCGVTEAAESSDIVPQVYEGGLKIWECARSLAAFAARCVAAWQRAVAPRPLRVLELGCGHGLPGIAALQGGATVHFCDFVCAPPAPSPPPTTRNNNNNTERAAPVGRTSKCCAR